MPPSETVNVVTAINLRHEVFAVTDDLRRHAGHEARQMDRQFRLDWRGRALAALRVFSLMPDQRPMVARRLFALAVLLLPLPAPAAEFSAEERQLVADIRKMMDKTTELLVYAYTNEAKMDLAEMEEIKAGFDNLSLFFKNIPDRRYERRTGSFCVSAGVDVNIYWHDTKNYKKYNGTETQKIISMPKNDNDLRRRQNRELVGHFISFAKCELHLDQVPTELEAEQASGNITISEFRHLQAESQKIVEDIKKQKKPYNPTKLEALARRAREIYKKYYSINVIYTGNLSCHRFADFPLYFITHYLMQYGLDTSPKKLPEGLYQIGHDGLLEAHAKAASVCENLIRDYQKKSPQ